MSMTRCQITISYSYDLPVGRDQNRFQEVLALPVCG